MRILLSIMVWLWGVPTLYAQAFLDNEAIVSVYDPPDTLSVSESDMVYIPVTYRLTADLMDSSVESITVWMGLESGENDILNQNFNLSVSETFADGSAITVNGSSFHIDLGQFTGLEHFHLRLLGLNDMGGVIHQLGLSYPED